MMYTSDIILYTQNVPDPKKKKNQQIFKNSHTGKFKSTMKFLIVYFKPEIV